MEYYATVDLKRDMVSAEEICVRGITLLSYGETKVLPKRVGQCDDWLRLRSLWLYGNVAAIVMLDGAALFCSPDPFPADFVKDDNMDSNDIGMDLIRCLNFMKAMPHRHVQYCGGEVPEYIKKCLEL